MQFTRSYSIERQDQTLFEELKKTKMGFSQILPLVMLAATLFTFSEAYLGKHTGHLDHRDFTEYLRRKIPNEGECQRFRNKLP